MMNPLLLVTIYPLLYFCFLYFIDRDRKIATGEEDRDWEKKKDLLHCLLSFFPADGDHGLKPRSLHIVTCEVYWVHHYLATLSPSLSPPSLSNSLFTSRKERGKEKKMATVTSEFDMQSPNLSSNLGGNKKK